VDVKNHVSGMAGRSANWSLSEACAIRSRFGTFWPMNAVASVEAHSLVNCDFELRTSARDMPG